MKMEINTIDATICINEKGQQREYPLYSREAFEALSHLWLKVGWNEKYPYTFSWMGRPLIQLPEDVMRIQEVIYRIKPDLIIETGVAHGGSLILYASLCKAMGKGRVIGVDIEIRKHNRQAIEAHELSSYITLIEGNSVDPQIVAEVANQVVPGQTVLVILDSNHTKSHVAAELEAYSPFVTSGSYIVATDGSMEFLNDVPRGAANWDSDNPAAAAREFAAKHPEFILEQPSWPFNESALNKNITHWPSAWLKRVPVTG
ncbi:cephalosporin hydroxylase family protein [Aquicella lusitana]|uniref:Cephalosporin hydroxylase n=1 Tax=Aquicella lusitana TaxID=254246 RepID=A0A370GWU3_9COXI|nr:CmcI family methyltransferase [Aquicella lusitana]RDI48155.1 cephalosporin hydroxylase [Aquicella lusitana]VVC72829.1 Rhamnosyl O-methyltransferase [Aquicella lusitana]